MPNTKIKGVKLNLDKKTGKDFFFPKSCNGSCDFSSSGYASQNFPQYKESSCLF